MRDGMNVYLGIHSSVRRTQSESGAMGWDAKSRQGLPRIPEQSMPPIHEGEMDRDLFEDDHNRAQHLRAQLGTDPDQTPGSFATPTPTTPASDHARSTSHGSNGKQRTIKCRDCGMVLQVEKLNPPERMQTASPKEQHPDHERDYRGILHGSGSARFVAIKRLEAKAWGKQPDPQVPELRNR